MGDPEDMRAALQRIIDDCVSRGDAYRNDRNQTDYGKAWGDGYGTALAHCSLIARKALDPEASEEADRMMSESGWLNDQEWFRKTGNCGHCGVVASHCICSDDDPCQCGPHEPSAWPLPCWACHGAGTQDPRRKSATIGDAGAHDATHAEAGH